MSTRVPTRRLVAAGLVAAAGLSLLLAVPSLRPVLDQLHGASSGWLVAAAALELASCLSFVAVFRMCFDRITARDARRVAWASMATGVLLPGGGVTGLAVGGSLMRRCGAPTRWIAQRSSALFFVTSAVNVAAAAIAGLVLATTTGGPRAWLPILVAGAATALVIAVPALAARGRAVERRWAGALIEGIRDAQSALARPHWRLLGAVGYLAFDVAVLWACFRALGDAPSPAALLLGYLLGYLANVVPVPGGVGVLDGGLVAALVLYGLPATHAVAAVLLYHALAFWLPSLGGLAAYAGLRRSSPARAMVDAWPPSLRWATPVSAGC